MAVSGKSFCVTSSLSWRDQLLQGSSRTTYRHCDLASWTWRHGRRLDGCGTTAADAVPFCCLVAVRSDDCQLVGFEVKGWRKLKSCPRFWSLTPVNKVRFLFPTAPTQTLV